MQNEIKQVIVLPDLSALLRHYQRYNYESWTALAEFVDNSTESWFKNKTKLQARGINGVLIKVDFKDGILTVEDNAYGMNYSSFENAIKLGKKPEEKSRNQYGFGLKTAACWFGDAWEIFSAEMDSRYIYQTRVDIEMIEQTQTNKLEIVPIENKFNQRGTTVVIYNVKHDLNNFSVLEKIKDNLQMKYKRDILSGEIKILLNGSLLTYEEPKILVINNREWKKNLNFVFTYANKEYQISGMVGIFAKGSKNPFERSGFALFSDNRTIVGGYDNNFKPEVIFGAKKSKVENKLFGELNLSGFEVNQAKDDYIWGDGLKPALVGELKKNITEYIEMANKEYKNMIPIPPGPVPTPSGPVPTPSGPVPAPSGPVPTPSGPVPTPPRPTPTLNQKYKLSINHVDTVEISVIFDKSFVTDFYLHIRQQNVIYIDPEKFPPTKRDLVKQVVCFAYAEFAIADLPLTSKNDIMKRIKIQYFDYLLKIQEM